MMGIRADISAVINSPLKQPSLAVILCNKTLLPKRPDTVLSAWSRELDVFQFPAGSFYEYGFYMH